MLLELVGEAYAFRDLVEFRSGFLELLGRLVPYDAAGYDEIGLGQSFDLTLPPFDPQLLRVFAELAHENPLVKRIRRTGDGRPYRISDVIDRSAFQRLSLYQRLYRHVGVEYQVAFTLASCRPLIIGLALCRERSDFSDQEVQLLALARPHLMLAYRHAEMLGAKAALLAALENGYDELGHHLVVLDPLGRVELATEGAKSLLGAGLMTRLPDEVSRWLDSHAAPRAAAEPFRLSGIDQEILVRALPTSRDDDRRVLLLEVGSSDLTAGALLGLGLTDRQAQALRLVVLGRTPAQTAAEKGIARRTVDKHLELAYAKLGVHTLAQATASAWAAVGIQPATTV